MTDAHDERLATARQHVDVELANLVEHLPALDTADAVADAFADPVLRARALGIAHRLDDVEQVELILLAALLVWERGD